MDTDEIFECIGKIESGKSIDEVAYEHHKLPYRLKSYLLQYGGLRGKRILIEEILEQLPVSIEEIKNQFREGKNGKEISKEIGMDYDKMLKLIREYESISGDKIGKRNVSHNRIHLDVDTIVKEYREGKEIAQIAEDYHVSINPIRRRLDEYKAKTGENIEGEHYRNNNTYRGTRQKKKNQINSENKVLEEKRRQEAKRIKLVAEIIKKHGYSYEQLSKIADEKGYEFSKLIYYQALNNIKRDEERDD